MPITPGQVQGLNSATFTFAGDVNTWCTQRLGGHFLSWFNTNIKGKGPWTAHGSAIEVVDSPTNRVGFHAFWNNIPVVTGGTATPFQFLALMGIFANECRANFQPVAERMGRTGFPGLAYLFDAIPGIKISYNTMAVNRTAQACFRSRAFLAAHGTKALAERLRNTADPRWAGAVYPRADFPTAPDAAASGIITETDFMKFRGRGFIQTTGRANYRKLIEFVQSYDGDNNILDFYADAWRGLTPDDAADTSANEDWDRLFQQTDLIIAARAVRFHSDGSGGYLALAGDPDAAIRNMGKRISGGDSYAELYRSRMEFLITTALA